MSEKRWWCSWYGPEGDYRPVVFPPDARILGWWCSGETDDGRPMLVAWVEAEDEDLVGEAIAFHWPEFQGDWRIEPKPQDGPPGDRFPRPAWTSAERWANPTSP